MGPESVTATQIENINPGFLFIFGERALFPKFRKLFPGKIPDPGTPRTPISVLLPGRTQQGD